MAHNESKLTQNDSLSLKYMFSGVEEDFGPTDWKIKPKTKKAATRPENDKNVPKVAKCSKKGPRKNFIQKQFLIAC